MTIPPDVAARMKKFLGDWNRARMDELKPGAAGMRLMAPHPLYRYLGQQGGLGALKQREPDGWRAFVRTERGDLVMLESIGVGPEGNVRLQVGDVPRREWDAIQRTRTAKRVAGPGECAMNAVVAPAIHRSWIWFRGETDYFHGGQWMSGEEWERAVAGGAR
jgi:hypothetical protein